MGKQNLSDIIADSIKDKIIAGEYKAGEQIPNEFDIAKEYNVSRFTVREAIKTVNASGLIEIKRGKGTYISKINAVSFMKPLLPMLVLNDNDYREICEARLAIEQYTVLLCVERADTVKIRFLEDIVKRMDDCLKKEQFIKYNALDMEFHTALAKISGNRILHEIFNTLRELLGKEINRVSVAPNANSRSIKRHREIIEGIRNRDVNMAVGAIKVHIQDAIDYLAEEKLKR